MIDTFQLFVRDLRDAGLAASPAETLDAMRAVRQIGLEDREALRGVLACTLAKRRAQREVFDRVFDATFVAPFASGQGKKKKGKGAGPGSNVLGAGERKGQDEGRGPRQKDDDDKDPEERQTARMETLLQRLRRGERPDLQKTGRLREVKLRPPSTGTSATRPGASRVDEPLRERLTPRQEAALTTRLPHWLRRLRTRRSRRLKRHRRGQLHVRRLLRSAAGRDGVPWELPRRRPRKRPAKLVLLLDVSYSTVRATALFLSIVREVLQDRRDVRVLLFVDRPIDATEEIRAWLDGRSELPPPDGDLSRRALPGSGLVRGGVSFSALLESLPDFNPRAASDYGRALDALARQAPNYGRRTVVVVLGDGRNNKFDPQTYALEELRERVSSILWLACEPVGRWGTGDSALADYAPWIDVLVEAHDVEGLARGALEVARRLGR